MSIINLYKRMFKVAEGFGDGSGVAMFFIVISGVVAMVLYIFTAVLLSEASPYLMIIFLVVTLLWGSVRCIRYVYRVAPPRD